MPRKKNYELTAQYFPGHIAEKLQQIKSYPLSIVEAPSGYGKTTAVREFFNKNVSESTLVLWHTFIGGPLSTSWKSLCKIFEQVDRISVKKMLELGTPNEKNILRMADILENMECREEMYVVLDNFQEINIPLVKHLVEVLVKPVRKNLHVVVITQQLSTEGTIMLNQNHRVYRIFPQDLTFTKSDAEVYFKQAGLYLTQEQLEKVHGYSDGRIAALYLQMLALVQTGDFASDGMDKLVHAAIWDKLSPEKQEGLIKLSVFQRFTLVQAVFMTDISSEIMETILRENLLIRFDRETRHFYIHSILRTYLLNIFANQAAEIKREIYMRGGTWFSRNSSYINALRFYHMADAPDAYEKMFSMPLTSLDTEDAEGEDIRPYLFDLMEKTDCSPELFEAKAMINVEFAWFFLGEQECFKRMCDEIAGVIDNRAEIKRLSHILDEAPPKIKTKKTVLSTREQEVYSMVVAGQTNKEIASQLFVSVSTVKTLVSRILEKMGVSSRTELAGKNC